MNGYILVPAVLAAVKNDLNHAILDLQALQKYPTNYHLRDAAEKALHRSVKLLNDLAVKVGDDHADPNAV